MGMFGANFQKEGKGVNKGELRPNDFSMFFILLCRKFFSYVKLNLMYALTCIPSILIMIYVFMTCVFEIAGNDVELLNSTDGHINWYNTDEYNMVENVHMLLLLIQFLSIKKLLHDLKDICYYKMLKQLKCL